MKTAFGLFDDYDAAQRAVIALEDAEISENDISLVSHPSGVDNNAGEGGRHW